MLRAGEAKVWRKKGKTRPIDTLPTMVFPSSKLRLARVRGAAAVVLGPWENERKKQRMKLGSVQVLKLNTRVVVKVIHMIN